MWEADQKEFSCRRNPQFLEDNAELQGGRGLALIVGRG